MSDFSSLIFQQREYESVNKWFTFIYNPYKSYPTAFITNEFLVFDMTGKQIGCVTKEGFFFSLSDYGHCVGYFNFDYNAICNNSGNLVACIAKSCSLPAFSNQKPSFSFDVNCCEIYDRTIASATGSNYCNGKIVDDGFLSMF